MENAHAQRAPLSPSISPPNSSTTAKASPSRRRAAEDHATTSIETQDPETLDTVGMFEYSDSLGGLIHSTHPIVTDREFLALLPDLVRVGYLVVRIEPGTNEKRVIGRVNCWGGPTPSWVHSFLVTQHYVVVPEMPLRYSAHNLLKAEPTPLYKFQWHPESKAFMHV